MSHSRIVVSVVKEGGRWREEVGGRKTYVRVQRAGKRRRYRIAPLGSRNTVGMSSKNNAPVYSVPSASASSRITLIRLDLVLACSAILRPSLALNSSTGRHVGALSRNYRKCTAITKYRRSNFAEITFRFE